MMNNDESKEAPSNELRCDYLVVGAGPAGMAFVDTLLTEDPTCRVVLVDRRAKAGGHWVDSYPFVRLHQPSHYYGVNSLPLGKARDAKGRECFDRDDLASGAEVVAYYEKVLAQFEASGRVDIRLETSYEARGARALLTTNDGTTSWVTPRKTVTTISNVQVPSTRPPPFPVADGVECRPLNALEVPAHVVLRRVRRGQERRRCGVSSARPGRLDGRDQWIVPHDRWMHCLTRPSNFGRPTRCCQPNSLVICRTTGSCATASGRLARAGTTRPCRASSRRSTRRRTRCLSPSI